MWLKFSFDACFTCFKIFTCSWERFVSFIIWILIYLIWGSDISNRAKILLSRWSKAFARSQALKKKNGIKSASDSQDEILLKQRHASHLISYSLSIALVSTFSLLCLLTLWLWCSISEVMGNGSWDCRNDAIVSIKRRHLICVARSSLSLEIWFVFLGFQEDVSMPLDESSGTVRFCFCLLDFPKFCCPWLFKCLPWSLWD